MKIILLILPTLIMAQTKNYKLPQVPRKKLAVAEIILVGNPGERITAIGQCGIRKLYFCYRSLVKVLKDPNPKIRQASVNSLADLALPKSYPHLIAALDSPRNENYPRIRQSIIRAIGFSGNSESISLLESYLGNEDYNFRRQAAFSLGKVGQKSSIKALEKQFEKEKVPVIRAINLHSQLQIDPNNQEKRKAMVAMLEDDDRWVRIYAAESIMEFKIMEARTPLKVAMSLEADAEVRDKLYKSYFSTLFDLFDRLDDF